VHWTSVTATSGFPLTANGEVVLNSTTIWYTNVVDLNLASYLVSGLNTIYIFAPYGAEGAILRSEIRGQDNQFTLITTESSWTSANNIASTVVAPYYPALWEILKTGGTVMNQAWTGDTFRTTYTTFDVTNFLTAGSDNVLGAPTRKWMMGLSDEVSYEIWGLGGAGIQYVKNYGIMRLWRQLNVVYNDGSVRVISSDNSWKTSPSPWTFTSVYGLGDVFRLEQQNWAGTSFMTLIGSHVIIISAVF
jgi:hypothetical protein